MIFSGTPAFFEQMSICIFSSDLDFFHIKSFFESIFNKLYHQSVSVCVGVCFEGGGGWG